MTLDETTGSLTGDADTCSRCGAVVPASRLACCPFCLLEPETEVAMPRVGGDLLLEEEIGSGGMGRVYAGQQLRLGRKVAVKLLPDALVEDGSFRVRFEREARAMAMLGHPHIAGVYDFGVDGERPYIVMEFLAGGSLAERLPVPPEVARRIAIELCDALHYAHSQGVVHRDIKPANVLFDGAGRAKLSDFGLARMLQPAKQGWTVTETSVAVGTPHYMAPEALAGEPPQPAMDIYSMGVLLYQMLTNALPVGDFAPAPAPFDRVVRRALAPRPEDRPASAAELRREIERLPVRVPPDSPADAGSDWWRRQQAHWLHAVALVHSVATATGLWAFVECLTPKHLPPAEVRSPLVMSVGEPLPDGRFWSPARFETWPVLGVLLAAAAALLAQGALRRHWGAPGPPVAPGPDAPLRSARWVLCLGMAAITLYGLRKGLERLGQEWVSFYTPFAGGVIEVAALFFFWVSLLEAWRRGRSLRREPLLWLGCALALFPPVVEFATYVLRAKP